MNLTTQSPQKPFKVFLFYGLFLILAGGIGFLSNPEKAQTALISGSVFGTLSIIFGVGVLRSIKWSFELGTGILGLLAVVFTWRSIVTWQAVVAGSEEKLFAACLISAMLLATLVSLWMLKCSKRSM
jgi:uncharacterized membrane protein (UPF0136 family)